MKLILGRLRPQSGNIFIHKNDSKQLNGNLLANTGGPDKCFIYYGLIYQLNSQSVNNRMDELNELFQLPSMDQSVGQILALLGCNGSGKTTLMKLILGRLRPQSGKIITKIDSKQLNGKQLDSIGPGVGYMPQEIALFNDFNIKQMFHYYGLIYQVDSQTVDNRMDELIELFQLPSMDQSVGTMSGGQQRLVSLAITLIHSPKLLLLDEPTVGVDSILRDRIWHYLDQLCHENNTTVIITTHYTEEARRADSVAFIYNGNCLANQSPNKLLETYRCSTLDDVYYELVQESMATNNNNKTDDQTVVVFNSKQLFKFHCIQALVMRNLIETKCRPWAYLCYYLLPFTIIYPSYISFNEPHNMPVAYDSLVSGRNHLAIIINNGFSDQIDSLVQNGTIIIDDYDYDMSTTTNHTLISLFADMTNPMYTTCLLI
ncbi:nod factor export ATP-binding protein I-like [Oppia nitens]|uniref:nod factor export ATP-binding protein I-like n=1 Tax=Oppia nitens TaxID=1686743 RepID=UPI0023DCD6A3|nr:nod factor export ATP-binding protein I-like [Oppia nitens]